MPARRAILLVLLTLVLAVAAVYYLTPLRDRIEPSAAVEWLKSAGTRWWSPLAYLGFYVVFTLILVPPAILSAAAALMWGWFAGGMVELVAATIASVIPYALARWSGADWLRAQIEKRGGGQAYERLRRDEFMAVLLLRLLPVIPYVILNYVTGFGSVKLRTYLLATFVGMIPSIFIFTYFVEAVAGGTTRFMEALPRIFAAGAALAVLAILTRVAAARLR